MDFGLYQLKYPIRRLIRTIPPMLGDLNPDLISWCILPVGIATAACYLFSDRYPILFIVGAILILLRMLLATLDGLLAESTGKSSPRGEIVNRLPPEISDVLLFLALAQPPHRQAVGLVAITIAWLTTFTGLLGLTAHAPIQSVGPAGQTDRLAILAVLSIIGSFARFRDHPFDVLYVFLWWIILAGTLTIILRLRRTFNLCPPSVLRKVDVSKDVMK